MAWCSFDQNFSRCHNVMTYIAPPLKCSILVQKGVNTRLWSLQGANSLFAYDSNLLQRLQVKCKILSGPPARVWTSASTAFALAEDHKLSFLYVAYIYDLGARASRRLRERYLEIASSGMFRRGCHDGCLCHLMRNSVSHTIE